MTKEIKIWALLMLANELASKDYVAFFGDGPMDGEEYDADFCMTDEVEAVMRLAHHKEELDKVQDLQQFIIDFYEKAHTAGWRLPWEDVDELFYYTIRDYYAKDVRE